jgi:hypothetical protein
MINKADLLDPLSYEKRSEYEKSVVEGAHNAGHAPRRMNTESTRWNHAGALQQVVNPSAIIAAECDAPGCGSDISDGIAELRETLTLAEVDRQGVCRYE